MVVLAADGEERSDTVVGSAAAGAATLLSDGTAAFLTAAGEAVGVRLGTVRFRRALGGGRSSVSPLALEDGGLVVATARELVALDGEGNVRARAALDPEDPPAHSLVGAMTVDGPTIYTMTVTGSVSAWVPSAGSEVTHVGTFRRTDGRRDGARPGRGKAHAPALVAVQGRRKSWALDPATGQLTTRATGTSAGALAFLGPPCAPPKQPGVVSLLALTASRTVALAFDANGTETLHRAVAPTLLSSLPDGGVGVGAISAARWRARRPRGRLRLRAPHR